ncbi:PE-PGRS family protein Wag22 [Mycobacterium tuberculosis variant africanum]|nr:PE-PGRS family protein Wag22 [Mycobacterium tuberculosis variant africanum]
MSFVIAVPETIAAAATDLADLGSTIAGANAAAAANTTSLLAAGADEISAAIAALFGAHGRAYQAASAEAAAFHGRFVQALTTGGRLCGRRGRRRDAAAQLDQRARPGRYRPSADR